MGELFSNYRVFILLCSLTMVGCNNGLELKEFDLGSTGTPINELGSACGNTPNQGQESRTRYQTATVPFGSQCVAEVQTRVCSNGSFDAWSGTYTESTCKDSAAQSCGNTPSQGLESRTRYQSASVPFGSQCVSEVQTRLCNNGVFASWSGNYSASSCSVIGNPNSNRNLSNYPAHLPQGNDQSYFTYKGFYIENPTNIPNSRALELVDKAIIDLGFNGSSKGPRAKDIIFVGQYYIAWIDQTGFYGKMNGLWPLNGQNSELSDFVLKEPNGRAINFLVVGENGDGQFAHAYSGADHAEITDLIPKTQGSNPQTYTDVYSHIEAFKYPEQIGWWGNCNSVRPTYDSTFLPINGSAAQSNNSWTVMYRGPLKVGGITYAEAPKTNLNNAECGADYYFPSDQKRHRVNLISGYKLYADKPMVDRLYQFENPAGNPPFGQTIMGVIGGAVLTRFPDPHPYKDFRHLRMHASTSELHPVLSPPLFVQWGETLDANMAWNFYDYYPNGNEGDSSFHDDYVATLMKPLDVSVDNKLIYGRSLTQEIISANNDDYDLGINFSVYLGAIELAGNVLHGPRSPEVPDVLPIAGGSSSQTATRRINLVGNIPSILTHNYLPKNMFSQTGAITSSGTLKAVPGQDTSNSFLVFGPYANDWGEVSGRSKFELSVDNNAGSATAVTIEIYDSTSQEIISQRNIRQSEFKSADSMQAFYLDFGLIGRKGHSIETRVFWHGTSELQVGPITSVLNVD